MLLYAPDRAALWHALGVLNAETGRPKAALDALGRVAGLDDAGVWQRQVARLMQQFAPDAELGSGRSTAVHSTPSSCHPGPNLKPGRHDCLRRLDFMFT